MAGGRDDHIIAGEFAIGNRLAADHGIGDHRRDILARIGAAVGGGEYLVNTFNAVAAWSGGGGYKSLIRVEMVMGLIYSLLVVTFTLNYRVWLNWFLRSEEHTSELQSLMRIS